MKTVIIIIIGIYVVVNLLTAHLCSAKEMKRDYVDGHCVAGKIFTCLFYAPAWAMKLIREVVVLAIR